MYVYQGGGCFFFRAFRMGCVPSRPVKIAGREEYLAQARTGDVPLFSSQDCDAGAIKFCTGSPYSHVGIVVVLDRVPAEWIGTGPVYLFHSPSGFTHGLKDLLSSPPRYKTGPQLNDMREVLKAYSHIPIDIRRLTFDENYPHPWNNDMGTVSIDSPMFDFMRKEHTKVYESSLPELIKAAYDGPGGDNVENLDEYFCSELVAEVFKRFGIMHTHYPSNEFTPGNFSSREDYMLGIVPQARLRHELRIVSK